MRYVVQVDNTALLQLTIQVGQTQRVLPSLARTAKPNKNTNSTPIYLQKSSVAASCTISSTRHR